MATLVGIFSMTHSPFCYMPPEKWKIAISMRTNNVPVMPDGAADMGSRSCAMEEPRCRSM